MGAVKAQLYQEQEVEQDKDLEIFQGDNLAGLYKLLSLNPSLDFYEAVQVYSHNKDATVVKTYDDWHGTTSRRITRGSKGIPVVDTALPNRKKYYFDITQTYGFAQYKATDSITDMQLIDAIKNQCTMSHESSGTFRDKLYSAVADYVDDFYSGLYATAVVDGLVACVVARYNKSKELIEFRDSNLDIDSTIKVVIKVHQLSTNLFSRISEYKSNLTKARSVANETQTKKVTINRDDTTSQQSFFDAFEEIRVDDKGLYSGEQSPTIHQPNNEQTTLQVLTPTPESSREHDGEIAKAIIDDNAYDREREVELYEQGTLFEEHRPDSTRDGDRAVHLQDSRTSGLENDNIKLINTAQNYKLTESDFEYIGGAKTKYKNNVAAIKLVKELQSTKSQATTEQQTILARYSGWGGIPQAFDNLNNDWSKEYTELKELLTDSEYTQARSSTLTSFYTSKTIIDGMYNALSKMGVSNVSILEPAMGIGNFIGLLPDSFKRVNDYNPSITGVELDPITGAIAKQLYPKANIQVSGFEETRLPPNSFDIAISNVPFGGYGVHDSKYNKYNLNIHDYFIVKSLDKVRVGGIVAVVTTKGTMDKASDSVRQLIATKGKLLGAIRLPNNAFKDSAGTKVTSDILFFQKIDEYEIQDTQNLDWLNVSIDDNGVLYNNYFHNNPQMVLGIMKKGMSMYGSEDETYCEPDDRDLSTALAQVIEFLPSNIYTPKSYADVATSNDNYRKNELPRMLAHTKNYCYSITMDNKIYMRIDDEIVEQTIPQSHQAKLIEMVYMREQVRKVLDVQLEGCSDDWLKHQQEILFGMYYRFTSKYGYLNAKANKNIFRQDADYSLLISLENYDEATGQASRTDIFEKRTIRKYTRPTRADNCLDALRICKNEIGKVDIKIIEQLTNKYYDEIVSELEGQIYHNPSAINIASTKYEGWETATEYLSGNVRQKLEVAKIISKQDSSYEKNVLALEQVQPIPLTASDISVRLGVGWIDVDIYKQFICEKFNLSHWSAKDLKLIFNKYTQSWKLQAPYGMKNSIENNNIYGTSRLGGHSIFEYAINLQTPNVYDTVKDIDNKDKRVLNKPETILAREKLRKIQEEFKAWIFDDPQRREQLVATYNEKFNNTRLAQYDGSYLDFPEMNPLYELKQYQKDAVERVITNGNTLLHHVVGAGKTFEIIASAMKLRQMKLANKPMIVVPNHLVLQWATTFRELYPTANLLIATEKDFEKENRLKFVSRIATGDWDSVVIAMSSFEKIPISRERQQRKIDEEIANIQQTLEDIRSSRDNDNRISIKTMERVLKNKQETLKELSDSKRDDLIKFEDLGVDYLFIDEAHNYKNRFLFSKMNNVAGISQTASKRASDLDMKIDYLSELHGGQKGVTFATGTPTSNSMVEMYTMQSYLAKDDLYEAGLHVFDNWAATFGETVTGLELAPSGKGYRSRTRFAKFTNLPELLTMYRKFADVKTSEMLNLPVPKANKHTITIKPTDVVIELAEVIADRAETISNGGVPPEVDNMLKVTSDGKKLALDPRCFDSLAPDNPDYKVNIAAENIYNIYENTKTSRGTQLVFCDLSTPKMEYDDYVVATNSDSETKPFDVYNHLKSVLVQLGIPKDEIAYIHEAKNDLAKQSLFGKVNDGKVRILIGSTQKCGAGTNVQKRLVALHHLDAPWRPADLEQREGRAIRQGNTNAEVDIYTYVTERTFDAYSYQILENKQRFISQVNRGELTVREAQDIDETTLSYAEIKAITSANPLIKRKQEVENELGNFKVLETQYRNNRYHLQDRVAKDLPNYIEGTTKRIVDFEKDLILRENNKPTKNADGTDKFEMAIAGTTHFDKKDASQLLHQYIFSPSNANKTIATYNGFEIIPENIVIMTDRSIILKGNGEYKVTVSDSPTGTMTRIDNAIEGLDKGLQTQRDKLLSLTSELETAKVELTKEFEHVQIISILSAELENINAQLNLDKKIVDVVIDDSAVADEPNTAIENDVELEEKPPQLTKFIEREKVVDYAM